MRASDAGRTAPPATWLIKSEPTTYAWAQLVADGGTRWDGIRNYQARNSIGQMAPGDLALYYHSNVDKAVVGVARITSAPYPDPSLEAGTPWLVVDVAPLEALPTPVTLAMLKAEPALEGLKLLRQTQLSVMPITADEFDRILVMGGVQAAVEQGLPGLI